ncbi:MAG TPA: insulinase family protein, partial [Candidatus Akkermansia intestinigallinarum]|nr:insulinase family protein [Candidatus Akkermansia intestinigallinarum]
PPQRAGRHCLTSDKEQAVLALAVPGLPAASPDLPLQLLFEEWCRDMAGPIFSEIREKRGLAYYAAATSLAGIDAGCLIFYCGTSQQQLPEAREALLRCLERLADEGMPEADLERSRATLLSSRLLSLQSAGRLGSAMALDTLLGLGADYSERVPELLRAVTPEQINDFIRRTLRGTRTELCVCNAQAAAALN